MNLFWVQHADEEWGCYVYADKRGRAKSLFSNHWGLDRLEFMTIRTSIKKKSVAGDECVCDDNCERLKQDGFKYYNPDSVDQMVFP